MFAAVARWIASSDRSVVPPICAAAGAIGSIASNRNPASTPTATAGACPPRRRAVRVTSTVASKLEARSGQRRSSWRSAAVSRFDRDQLDEGRGVQVCDPRATRHADARREARPAVRALLLSCLQRSLTRLALARRTRTCSAAWRRARYPRTGGSRRRARIARGRCRAGLLWPISRFTARPTAG